MMNIIENLHEKESVISELHTKIRTLENDTPKSSPETYGNGEERKNLSEPKRHSEGFYLIRLTVTIPAGKSAWKL